LPDFSGFAVCILVMQRSGVTHNALYPLDAKIIKAPFIERQKVTIYFENTKYYLSHYLLISCTTSKASKVDTLLGIVGDTSEVLFALQSLSLL
jgi:hypothetical protein